MINIDSHQNWIREISKIIDDEDPNNVVRFALSYTLQSLRHNREEVFTKFKWD